MVSYVHSVGLSCLSGYIASVEADVSDGMPGMELVGYLGSEVKEARERIRMALRNSGYELPVRRITLNIAPANVRKSGTGFDLPMAIAILISLRIIKQESVKNAVFIGELGLSGNVCGLNGVLPLILEAKKNGFKECFIPNENVGEASVVTGIDVYPVMNLQELIWHLTGEEFIEKAVTLSDVVFEHGSSYENDFRFIRGQHFAKRGLEVAAAGLHNIILIGAPGAGKTMLSKCIPSILPPLSMDECLEVSSIYSVAGKLSNERILITERPFIAPHHTVTDVALAGGGNYPKAGLIAQAHKGVLFLDEMPEFNRKALEILRQPLEDKYIRIIRNSGSYTYPADFMLVGAMNPCPCGAYPDKSRCSCTYAERKHYMDKLSKPLMDRIDICIEVDNLKYEELKGENEANLEESSLEIRQRVIKARKMQLERFGDNTFNSHMNQEQIKKYCALSAEGEDILKKAFKKYHLSARAYHRVLRVARTIADLDESENIKDIHLMEALHFRFSGKDEFTENNRLCQDREDIDE